MAEVARACDALAKARGDIVGLPGYCWVGGIDFAAEKGLRNRPEPVRAAHREVGRVIVAP